MFMNEKEVVWITGGGSGIGQAMATEYASRGFWVVISGRREDRLIQVQKDIETSGGTCLVSVCDVSQDEEIQASVAQIIETCGRLDIVIANAGFSVSGRLEWLDSDDWRRQFDVNVIGAMQTVRFSLPHLEKTNGRTVLISSVMAYARVAKAGAYAASKAALTAIGETLHQELLGTGISCTVVHPGFVESEIGQVNNDGVYQADAKDRRPAQLLWTKEKAAKVIFRAVAKRKRLYVFTAHGKFAVWMARHCPGLIFHILAFGNKKKREISLRPC
jgi:short-subunit dehydrogenase